MADQVSTATIRVEIEGEAQLHQITQAFQQMRGAAPRPRPVAAGAAVARAVGAAVGLGEETAERIGAPIVNAVMAPFNLVGNLGRSAYGSLLSFLGPVANMGVGVAGVTATMGGLAIALAAITVPAVALAGVFRLMRSTFTWAEEGAESRLQSIARARRTFPGIIGEAFGEAQRQTSQKFKVAAALMGREAVDSLEERITRRFTEFRLGRGLAGERDIFERWGITPQALDTLQQVTGQRVSVNDWLFGFISERERLQAIIAQSPEGSAVQRAAIRRQAQLTDDSIKLFGSRFSDIINTWSTEDFARLTATLEASAPLAAGRIGQDVNQEARDFKIAAASLFGPDGTFAQLRRGIGQDVQPGITNFMTRLQYWLLDVDENGRSMGISLRNLASALATHAWDTLAELISRIDVRPLQRMVDRIVSWATSESPARTANGLLSAASGLKTFADIIVNITTWITSAIDTVTRLFSLRPGRDITPADIEEAVEAGRISATDAAILQADPTAIREWSWRNIAPSLFGGPRAERIAALGGAAPVSAGAQWPGVAAALEAGAAPLVAEQQAGTRNLPISAELRGILQAAAASSGLQVRVTSGGQPVIGTSSRRTGSTRHDVGGGRLGAADLQLVDPSTGRVLDMRNPADQARMQAFTTAAVARGATGVGAGLGYMGASTIHVGGGAPAHWGGASWVGEARLAGEAQRGAAPPVVAAGGPATPATGAMALQVPVAPGARAAHGGAHTGSMVAELMQDLGLTRDQAAGLVGNLAHETGGFRQLQELRPLAGAGGLGWAQWTGPRRTKFVNWARANGLDPASYEANMGFLKHELRGEYAGFLNQLKGTRSAAEASHLTHQKFETPYDVLTGTYASSRSRAQYAQQALNAPLPMTAVAAAPEPTPRAIEQQMARQEIGAPQQALQQAPTPAQQVAALQQTPPRIDNARAIQEGTAAGEAAATAFKREVAEVAIPIKSLTHEESEREAA